MDNPGPSVHRPTRGKSRRQRYRNTRRSHNAARDSRAFQKHFQVPQKRNNEDVMPAIKDMAMLPPPNKVRRVDNKNNGIFSDTRQPAPFDHPKTHCYLSHTNNYNMKHIPFKVLESIALSDNKEILMRINENRNAFLNLIKSQIDKPDIFVLLTTIMAKVAQCSFTVQKSNLLIEICHSKYMESIQSYLTNLPYTSAQEKSQNRFYWENQELFWDNFITFCECIVNISPSTALQRCRPLIHDISKCCLECLNQRHGLNLPEQTNTKLSLLREKLEFCETEQTNLKQNHREYVEEEPPESFRELNVVPSSQELLNNRPFVRPNIVRGAYRDVEHYLDVQFRLLREDCFGPLRDGIRQYIDQPTKKKYDHIRVYKNVKFAGPYMPKSQNNVGSMVQVNMDANRWMKRVNWAHSKRLLYGSLLLFTKDNCDSFIVATILDRDIKMLYNGMFAVSYVNMAESDINGDELYTMIESGVYFVPYYHVLQALQDPEFPIHVAMKQYIVGVDCTPKPPAYLEDGHKFCIKTEFEKYKFNVLDDSQWPTKEELSFNESQYKAFKLALTNEFAIIQGPPGTGKTFLGVKLAQTLLTNCSVEKGTIMLVICYTNHALDQFLEAIMGFTESVVRIGGRSRNEDMDKINLHTLRRHSGKVAAITMNIFYKHKKELHYAVHRLKEAMENINSVRNSVISFKSIATFIPESNFLAKFYVGVEDPLKTWLFENYMEYLDSDPVLWDDYDEKHNEERNIDDDFRQANDAVIDDFEEDNDFAHIYASGHSLSFSLHTAEMEVRHLTNCYQRCYDRREKRFFEQKIQVLRSEMKLFKIMSAHRNRDSRVVVARIRNPAEISTIDRWCLYFKWANTIIADITETIPPLQEALHLASTAYEETRTMVDLEILKDTQVVAMTTSGAARLRKLVQSLAPPIVIVEEAAEVMEQHLVTSLNKDCEHLILIGDHQQLRPSIANLKMARRQHADVSLFERMITNGMRSQRLGVQHRMRPEIAALISPHIYPDLQNHPSVHHFPDVRGITKNLYFFTHNFKEQEIEDSESRSNHKEADLTLGLANYLVQQGYSSEDVTILTTYAGQLFFMNKQREKYPHLSAVKITVVDNYQGEESKIILLSLVRNNACNEVGFLKIENRICVALSRAREGLFIFGNIETLKSNSELWKNIATTLESYGSLGTTLTLKCENHPRQITKICSVEDFSKVPEGGCQLPCGSELKCGHKCTRICHGFDREHKNIRCHETCTRVLCDLGHVCPLKCAVPCAPCKQLVEKTLPCEHRMQVRCHIAVTDRSIKCPVIVPATLPCGHKVKKECHQSVNLVECSVRCKKRVEPCGHECGLKCHVNHDPDHEEYICRKPCAKPKNGCTANDVDDASAHKCKKKCFEQCDDCNVQVLKTRSTCSHSKNVACSVNIDETACTEICGKLLPCGHKCQKKCFEPCSDCSVKVKKTITECKHEVTIKCSEKVTSEMCRRKCERKLTCGHQCPNRCAQPCDASKCTKLIPKKIKAPCGHTVVLPCNISTSASAEDPAVLLSHCMEPCTEMLACKHMCGGSCAACHQGRLHAACTQTCHQMNICGHQCEEPCNQVCPPCKMPCIVRCPHTFCGRACGAPCVPCMEKCTRRCPHGACRRRCGEPCSRSPCNKRCARRLQCGHGCRGLCGEPCPEFCKLCYPDDPRKDLGGYDFDDEDILIQLADCTHIMTLENMDNMMKIEQEEVKIPTCPWCREPILNTPRYKHIINRMLKKEINPIKERVYGTNEQIREKREALHISVGRSRETYKSLLQDNQHWRNVFDKLNLVVRQQKQKVSLLKLEMQSQYLTILKMIGDYYKEYKKSDLTELQSELFCLIKIICSSLSNVDKISQQQQVDIGNELKRMNAIIQFSKILSHSAYLSTKAVPKVATATDMAKQAVLSWHKFDDKEARTALMRLQEEVKVSGVVTREERELVVRAVGLKAGHWYKCPQGHFYCIGECGGAMEVARCPECGSRIGGSGHRLLADNAHAPEVDGSRFAAWSEEYNNMANFHFE